MKNILILIFAMSGSSKNQLSGDKWPQVWLGYKKQILIDDQGNHQPYEIEGQGVLFHGIELHLMTSGRCSSFVYPIFIKEKDTTYSTSEGGFFSGRCNYTWSGDSIHVAGKYFDIDYIKVTDSTFKYELSEKRKSLIDEGNQIQFRRYLQRTPSWKKK